MQTLWDFDIATMQLFVVLHLGGAYGARIMVVSRLETTVAQHIQPIPKFCMTSYFAHVRATHKMHALYLGLSGHVRSHKNAHCEKMIISCRSLDSASTLGLLEMP